MKIFQLVTVLSIAAIFAGCGGGSPRYQKAPVDDLIRDLSTEPDFSIILYDMDYNESSRNYLHQYQIVIPRPQKDTVEVTKTGWKQVPESYFNQNVNNMGMEIVSKVDGKLKKAASPAGYNHYVGNKQYGHWVQRDGGSFWEFYGKYAFMSSMFNMMAYPARRSYYNDYYNNYRGYGRSYYGPTNNGRSVYGTGSRYNASRSTAWNSRSNDFKSKVRSRVNRSRSTTSRWSTSSSARKSRSSSRSSSSSFRSRGGGFGK